MSLESRPQRPKRGRRHGAEHLAPTVYGDELGAWVASTRRDVPWTTTGWGDDPHSRGDQ